MAPTPQPLPPCEGEGEIQQSVTRRVVELFWTWAPVLAWMALILALSGQSDLPARTNLQTGETIRTTFAAAKLVHVFEYSVLALLLLRALTGVGGGVRLSFGAAVVVTVLVAGLFGALDEFRQSFVPRREPRLSDVALDTASAVAACLLVGAWIRLRSSRPPGPSRSPVPALPLPRAGEEVGS
jgi:hypothetical protein